MPRPSKNPIPTQSCDTIIRDKIEMSGHRVSKGAAECLAEILTEVGIEIGNSAFSLMTHAGRRTVQRIDIEVAYRMLLPKIIRIPNRK